MKDRLARFRAVGAAVVEAESAARAGDHAAEARALRRAAVALHAWCLLARADLPPDAEIPPTPEERKAQRRREFPDVGAPPGPKKASG